MERNQKINCTVGTCKYNNEQKAECELQQIEVKPIQGCNTKKTDESTCYSYKYE